MQCFGGDNIEDGAPQDGLDERELRSIQDEHLKKVLQELRRGDKSNINAKDAYGNAPLHLALQESSLFGTKKYELLSYLLQKGADINAQDEDGNTPLNALFQKSYDEGMLNLFLKQKKIDVDKADNEGVTPLMRATEKLYIKNYETTLKLLLRKGPNMAAVDKKKNTVLHRLAAKDYPTDSLERLELLLNNKSQIDAKALQIKNNKGHSVLHTILLGDIFSYKKEKAFEMVINKMKEEFKKSGITEAQCKNILGYHKNPKHDKSPSWSWYKDEGSTYHEPTYKKLAKMEQELYESLSSS